MKLGVVVFGAGIAGKVRIRDIGAKDFQSSNGVAWDLIGFVSRRSLDIEGVAQLTEEEAFSRSDVHAVIVCTENASHESVIRKALENKKHVLVEFPVTTSAAVTQELLDIATAKGLVLHEENIALLTDSFLTLKQRLLNVSSSIVRAELKLTASYNGWIEDVQKSGGPFIANISLLQTMYELVGSDLTAISGQLETSDDGFTATAKLSSSKCKSVEIKVKRKKERGHRMKELIFTLADGSVVEDKPGAQGSSTVPKKPGLFMQDFLQFVENVQRGRTPEDQTMRTVQCMKLAEELHNCMGLNSGKL